MKICFVTDGGQRLGMGHVQQSTTLAAEFPSDTEISFLTKSEEPVLALIRRAGFEAAQLDSDDSILRYITALQPAVVVFDKLDVDEALAREIRRTVNCGLVIFTNLTDANRYAHLAVIADIGSQFENVRSMDESTGTTYFYGPKYWILRREFYDYQKRRKPAPTSVDRILLIFGGSDPANLTAVALDELLRVRLKPRVNVILGAHFSDHAGIATVLEEHSGNVENVALHRNVENVAEMMYWADLVIASPGLSTFEALCVGTPVIVIPQDELQRDTYRGFIRMLERDDARRLGEMIDRADFSFAQDEHIAAMEIGQGVADLVSMILHLGEGVGRT